MEKTALHLYVRISASANLARRSLCRPFGHCAPFDSALFVDAAPAMLIVMTLVGDGGDHLVVDMGYD